MRFLLLIGCFAFALLSTDASAIAKTLLGAETPLCNDISFLLNNFFHAVTCNGYVRVAMKDETSKSMNAKIDKILGAQGNASCAYEVKSFYYDEFSLIFLRYPLLRKDHKIDDKARVVSYWIVNVDKNPVDQFVPFPEESKWTPLGKGYWEDDYKLQVASDAKGAICDPKYVYYDPLKHAFVFTYLTISTINSSGHAAAASSKCAIIEYPTDYAFFYVGTDPIFPSQPPVGARFGSSFKYNRDDYFTIQNYGKDSFQSVRERESNQYYLVLNMRDPLEVEQFEQGKIDKLNIAKNCYLRKFRHDLGEFPYPYVLPRNRKAKIIALITTTTASPTTTAHEEDSTFFQEEDDGGDFPINESEDDQSAANTRNKTDEIKFSSSIYANVALLVITVTSFMLL